MRQISQGLFSLFYYQPILLQAFPKLLCTYNRSIKQCHRPVEDQYNWRTAYRFSWGPSTPLLHLGPPAGSRWTSGPGSSGHRCRQAPTLSHTGAHHADRCSACGGCWAHTGQRLGCRPDEDISNTHIWTHLMYMHHNDLQPV